MLLGQYIDLLTSYISNRYFRLKQEGEFLSLKDVNSGIPRGAVLGPILYLLYTCDIPQNQSISTGTIADDIAEVALGSEIQAVTVKLQTAVNEIQCSAET